MLNKEDASVFAHLQNNWNFSLKYFRFQDIFKEGLMGKDIDIDGYITDKSLIATAKQLQNELNGYMMMG
jgi:hypothetical protein